MWPANRISPKTTVRRTFPEKQQINVVRLHIRLPDFVGSRNAAGNQDLKLNQTPIPLIFNAVVDVIL